MAPDSEALTPAARSQADALRYGVATTPPSAQPAPVRGHAAVSDLLATRRGEPLEDCMTSRPRRLGDPASLSLHLSRGQYGPEDRFWR